MRRMLLLLPILSLAGTPAMAQAPTTEMVVGWEADVTKPARTAALARASALAPGGLGHGRALRGLDASVIQMTEAARAQLTTDPRVSFIEPVFQRQKHLVPTDDRFADQWGLDNSGAWFKGMQGILGSDMDVSEAWTTTTGVATTVVAVIDDGWYPGHPDLASRLYTNPGETPGNGLDDDNNGYVDDVSGWDFLQDNSDGIAGDDNDPDSEGEIHGSHVAGIISAAADGTGVVGVAPNVRFVPLRVCGAVSCPSSAIAEAIAYAGDMGFPVVNMSLGGSQMSSAENQALTAAPQSLFVVAAGNDGLDTDSVPMFPCAAPHRHIICVAATDARDRLAGFSNRGAVSVDVGAPGVNILSTVPVEARNTFYEEGFEGAHGWTTGGTASWATTTERAYVGLRSLTDSPGGMYLNDADTFAESPPLNLVGETDCSASLAIVSKTEDQFDDVTIYLGRPSAPDITLAQGSGTIPMQRLDVDLAAAEGFANRTLGVRLTSDESVRLDGVHIDDVRVTCVDAADTDGLMPGYDFLDGTSMASPMAAGVAALLHSECDCLTQQIRSAILRSVDLLPALNGVTRTGGRVNAARALELIATDAVTDARVLGPDSRDTEWFLERGEPATIELIGGSVGGVDDVTLPPGVTEIDRTDTADGMLLEVMVDDSGALGVFDVIVLDDGSLLTTTCEGCIRIVMPGALTLCPPSPRHRMIYGTPGQDMISGGPGRDFICGFGGGDTLTGNGGADLLDGGNGRDRLRGSDGPDTLRLRDGREDLPSSGGKGADVCILDRSDDVTTCEDRRRP